MKTFFSIVLLFFCASAGAQTFPQAFYQLEGDWYVRSATGTTWMRWIFPDDQTMIGAVFTVVGTDTLPAERMWVHAGDCQLHYAAGADTQVYKLRPEYGQPLVWKNLREGALPAGISWDVRNSLYMIYTKDGQKTGFTLRKGKNARLELSLRAGANLTRPPALLRKNKLSPFPQVLQNDYTPGAGFEVAIAFGLRSNIAPVGAKLELGYTSRSYERLLVRDYEQVKYTQDGHTRTSALHLAFLPEVFFGKKEQWSFEGGVFMELYRRQSFEGQVQTNGPGTVNDVFLHPEKPTGMALGLIAGLNFQATKHLCFSLRQTIGRGATSMSVVLR